ncbi:hypothetical protein [Streptomyces sp. TR06-5]|uniref:hypothetical protein n=1 Tax=unclassified Streptomyces TaxID=2593676 RepID=UPI00399F5BE0
MTAARPVSAASASPPAPARRPASVPARQPLPKAPLPAGQPRDWYTAHNRQLKAMRLAIALLDAGVLSPRRATDRRICLLAERIGVHRPSRTTCRLVRTLLPAPPRRRR